MIHQRPSSFHARDREIALMPMAPDERPVMVIPLGKALLWAALIFVTWVPIILGFMAITGRL